MTASTMMIKMTIINSSSVKPFDFRLRMADGGLEELSFIPPSAIRHPQLVIIVLPITVLCSVERRAVRFGGHIEDAGIGVIGAGAGMVEGRMQTPIVFAGHRVFRHRAQVNLLLVRQ